MACSPYFGSPFFESLGNVIGLEDIQDLGIKYIQNTPDWNLQAGYYLRPIDQGQGTSRGGRTYSTSVAKADTYVADGSSNQERNIVVGRLARNLKLGNWQSEVGASALTSELENRDTHDSGRRNAVAVHYLGKNGPWGVQLQATRQDMTPRNPGNDKYVTFGSYDATFNVAAKGDLYVTDLSYDIAGKYGWLSGIKLYGNYSLFDKRDSAFHDSQRFILGTSFSLKGPLDSRGVAARQERPVHRWQQLHPEPGRGWQQSMGEPALHQHRVLLLTPPDSTSALSIKNSARGDKPAASRYA